jgi:hypothetical protein
MKLVKCELCGKLIDDDLFCCGACWTKYEINTFINEQEGKKHGDESNWGKTVKITEAHIINLARLEKLKAL